jgi:hypothetical protein
MKGATLLCILGFALWGIVMFVAPANAMLAYLSAYAAVLFCVLGALFFVMLHHVVDAGWSTVVRRWAEQMLAALPLLAVMAIPIVIGAGKIFHWAHGDNTKSEWLNLPFFALRLAIYFAIWIGLARMFRGYSLRQDETGDPGISLRLRKWAAPCLLIYGLSVNFAAIDLLMTPDYHWYSTIFGVYVWAQGVICFFAVLALMALGLRARDGLRDKVPDTTVRTIGLFLFAFACFWGYQAVSQWLLIWYANIPEETYWLLMRWEGGWRALSVLSVAGLFGVPFVVLMSEQNKQRPILRWVATLAIVGHFLGLLWVVLPTATEKAHFGAKSTAVLGASCLIAGAAAIVIRRAFDDASPYPTQDPRLPEALPAAEGEH